MQYKVTVHRNSLSITVEEAIVEADSIEEAEIKAKAGECEDVNIVECSDVSELSSEVVSVIKIEE
jgi:hypothetical protein